MPATAVNIDLSLLAPLMEKYKGATRKELLPMLYDVQAIYGWLPREAQKAVSETLRVPLSDIHGVVEFYSMFYNKPTGRTVVRVCEDITCQLAGLKRVKNHIEDELELSGGETDFLNDITLEYVPCLGLCNHAPAALFGDKPLGNLDAAGLSRRPVVDGVLDSDIVDGNVRICTELIEDEPLTDLASYERRGGFGVLRSVLALEQEKLLNLIDQAGILGRGGALFPLGRKLRYTQNAPGSKKHIIVNADESEPGTFKDRVLMEKNPYSVIEAALICAYAVGASKGWIFVRGEYPRCQSVLLDAVYQCRKQGFLGRNILGNAGFDFDIELRKGAGAYICGEETALFEAIEGKRGFPRIKPPFPVTVGLFGEPTAINNVETIIANLAALRVGIDQWRQYGTEESPGTKLFCLSGHVARPGLYEVTFGTTIRELIELAGGVPNHNSIKAILIGGAAGSFVKPDLLDMPLTYEDARKNHIPLGSGVIMVLDETTNLRRFISRIGEFFAHESCGKCFPCQLGTERQAELLHHIEEAGSATPAEKQALLEIGQAMTETSICGLGQTAASAVMSAISLWPELFE